MIKALIVAALLLVLLAGGLYYHFGYPPEQLRRAAQQAFTDFDAAVASKDRAKIGAALNTLFTDDAEIKIDIRFYSFTHQDHGFAQSFTKEQFTPFIDNILYSLQNYGSKTQLESFHLSLDRKSADITFSGTESGDGNSYYSGTAVGMRFSTETTCKAEIAFEGKQVHMRKADCTSTLYSLPKPGEENKLRNPDALRQYLQR